MFGSESTGWRTEALIVVGGVIGLALLGDLAGKYDLPKTAEVVGLALAFASQVLSFLTARARAAAVKG